MTSVIFDLENSIEICERHSYAVKEWSLRAQVMLARPCIPIHTGQARSRASLGSMCMPTPRSACERGSEIRRNTRVKVLRLSRSAQRRACRTSSVEGWRGSSSRQMPLRDRGAVGKSNKDKLRCQPYRTGGRQEADTDHAAADAPELGTDPCKQAEKRRMRVTAACYLSLDASYHACSWTRYQLELASHFGMMAVSIVHLRGSSSSGPEPQYF